MVVYFKFFTEMIKTKQPIIRYNQTNNIYLKGVLTLGKKYAES